MKEKSENIPAGQFKAECLSLMDIVAESGMEYVITKRGKPVAKLVPLGKKMYSPIFGSMKGTVHEIGDITAPLEVDWDAHEGA